MWGEDAASGAPVCPGEAKCDDWQQPFAGPEEKKEEAICFGCRFFETKPAAAAEADDLDYEEADDLVLEIEDMIRWEDAGFATDWSLYSFSIRQLYLIWRTEENRIKRLHDARMQALIRGFMKDG